MWHERLGTILIVVTLTGLIWFFADRANKDSRTIKVLVTVQPAGNVIVLGQDPRTLEFDVTVSAPRGVISEIEKQTQGQPLRGILPLHENVAMGLQTFRADTELVKLDSIQQHGLAIVAVKPETFTLEIDRLVSLPAVRIRPQFPGLEVDVEAPHPTTCAVQLPSSLADQLAGGELAVDVSRYVDATQSGTDAVVTKTVPLQWPNAVGGAEQYVVFEPATFTLKYRLKDTTAIRRFESVQVRYDVMPDVAAKYQIVQMELGEWRPTIAVSGPKQRIDTLQKQEIQLLVSITSEDEVNVGKPIRRPVWEILPPGIQLVGPRPEVRFMLQDRTLTTTTGG